MHEHQQNQRIAAARAFKESLDQLQNILAQEPQTAESVSQKPSELQLLEEAGAELDTLFGDQEPLEKGMLDEESSTTPPYSASS
jgi:hypothetical protein